MISIRHFFIAALSLLVFPAGARESTERCDSATSDNLRPVLSTYNLEIGAARNFSNYLSPLYYSGTSYGLSGSWAKRFNRWSNRCEMRFEGGVTVDDALNPAKTARMMGVTARFGWGLGWYRGFARDWTVGIGPMLDVYGGALYVPRNGNNPVAALASAGIDLQAGVAWRHRIGKFPIIVSEEFSIPTLSAFFCPGYGESYYEIYLGNRKDLVHCGWWGNAPGINNLLSFKINFGKTGLQIGYRLDLRTFRANNLDTQLFRNALVIGVIPNGF